MVKNLRPTRGRALLEEMIAEGEHERQDFKYTISDARKIARSLSAFSNHLGGRLLIGVKDSGQVAGVRSEEDVYMIETAAQVYCRPEVPVEFKALKGGDDGCAVVVVVTVPPRRGQPVCVREADGSLRAYVRCADENIAAPPLLVRAWRRQTDRDGGLLSLGGAATAVMDAVDLAGAEGVTPAQLYRRLQLSSAAIDDAVVALVAVNTLEFRHLGGEFRLVPAP